MDPARWTRGVALTRPTYETVCHAWVTDAIEAVAIWHAGTVETLVPGTAVSAAGMHAQGSMKHWYPVQVFQAPVGARSSAARIAATWAGVEPQQAPITPTPSSRIWTA